MAFIDDIKIWAETLDIDATTNTPQRLEISDNLWDKGYLRDVPVTGQSLNQFMHLLSGAILEMDTFESIFDRMYHVGYVHTVIGDPANPATYLGRGTWVAEGQGRVLVGAGQGTDSNGTQRTFTEGSSDGEYTHNITTDELPSHNHNVSATTTVTTNLSTDGNHNHSIPSDGSGGSGDGALEDAVPTDPKNANTGFAGDHSHTATSTAITTVTENSVGGGSAMNNIQPYLTVYMWRRTA